MLMSYLELSSRGEKGRSRSEAASRQAAKLGEGPFPVGWTDAKI